MFKYILLTVLLTVCLSAQSRFDEISVKGSQDSVLAQDASTNAILTIDYAHHEVHSGSHFYIEGIATMGSGDTLLVSLTVPDTTKWSHFQWEIGSSLILWTGLYEDAVTDSISGGSAVTPLNNNRNSADTSLMIITSGVSCNFNGFGTLISQSHWGARALGGSQKRDDELILEQNTTYIRVFVSSSATNRVAFKASWYEHRNRN